MSSNLLILGAGQYGALVYEIAESLDCYEKIDFLDDHPSEKTVGVFVDSKRLIDVYDHAVVAIGNSPLRLSLLETLKKIGYTIPVLIHPKAYVSRSASIGEGSIIEPLAVVQTEACVGRGCLISAGAVVNHNAHIEDGCHIDCNATVSAGSLVECGTKIVAYG